ncbi:hypothetical protein PV377_43725 [Streptomyces ipomoeae]|uniref:hypothetical protein n=1 Tax=Streptomyces ipomoeae TaxID=103232 RepID=UPI0029B2F469|nr:hypothetical protein [Streptomyces ipomoeae]MDX2845748.1 hypothetical protein [Streptomyces ipomoeae]
MNTAAKVNTLVWLHPSHAEGLARLAEENDFAEWRWLAEERQRLRVPHSEPTPQEIRVSALDQRPVLWPRMGLLTETAMRARLALPDLAGPWPPFTAEEAQAQRLSGRRPGSPNEHFGAKLMLDIAADVVDSARLAAYRVSEPAVRLLQQENLIGPRPARSKQARARKLELQGQIYTVGRIARESIAALLSNG